MLKQISCDLFKNGDIIFHDGLNVVLGDNHASNSIGKSTLLMIIDFVFGGNSYMDHNKDVVTELGHHKYEFIFEFSDNKYYFIRETIEPKIVYKCTSDFKKIKDISLNEFSGFLKSQYSMTSEHLSFRSAVSLFSRIWGKHNLDVKRPLHTYPKEKNVETVKRFLLLFNKYDQVIENEKKLKILKDSRSTLNKASKYDYLPKITKSRYEKNLKKIEIIETEVAQIRENIFKYTLDLSGKVSEEVLQLQNEKNGLLRESNFFKSRLNRINRNLNSKHIRKKFDKLLDFFPSVNLTRLEKIEEFHDTISKILDSQLRKERTEIQLKVQYFTGQLQNIDEKMERLLKTEGQPKHLVEQMYNLSTQLRDTELENKMYLESINIKEDIEVTSEVISQNKKVSLTEVTKVMNQELMRVNDLLHTDKRKAPVLELYETDYDFKVTANKGTGKAYANLFILDLSVFELTQLPILIHDSLLFKNIEDSVIENIIDIYNKHKGKQIFIAIDSINRFSEAVQNILIKSKVISLSNNVLLFVKDWRS